MSWHAFLPLGIVLSSLLPGLVIFGLREDRQRLRVTLNLLGVTLKLVLVGSMLYGVSQGSEYRFSVPLLPGVPLVLQADALALLFVALSSLLWAVTTIYAIGYLENSPLRSRFFGYFSLCVSATVGLALAGNLVSFLLFYELLTLATFPLVVHRGTPESLAAGRVYLAYTVGGGSLVLMGVALLHSLAGTPDFQAAGYLLEQVDEHDMALRVAFALLILGLGVKAALIPLHGWLPQAMVAPAPVSALLHAVAVVKAGAFGIVRVVYDVFGAEALTQLDLTTPLLWLAAATILYGSLRALQQQELKKRLAYSTISQVSYVTLGVALLGPVAAVGGLVHLVHQGLMKVTLFYCAGNFAETLGIHRIREMDGVGRRMPWTMTAFSIGALGMIGIPPIAGFISKWTLGLGALEVGQDWVLLVLLGSALLNAAYFLPLLWRGWFAEPADWHENRWADERFETHWMLLLPPLITALLSLLVGLLAATALSPLGWSQLIVEREFAI
ncbi:monovalent cation/H+ antiporter subunit D family protein [Stutzerimonas chloritidismutans]|jgi:multicomponent Na+:H+ antiporter subunit D|uniref:complex I subunit 5 family protein n=1 Tax=Stutzerimonas stutzeri subgroup TaxID=578833 RepID=UPI001746675C|nr:proton-conducting transporter membrane subunit [Stutzerimonas kunmingensis]MBD3874039.1 monovalent cation/H+ antiporter subunit D family protein [Stutzerimonas kunmingensis]|tara:strand:- start:1432 stop:2928 length:1497 start_codon:yes stop_codon:yes gene_type:complete